MVNGCIRKTDYQRDLNDLWGWKRKGKSVANNAHDPMRIERGSSILKRAMGSFVAYPDAQRNWYKKALVATKIAMREERFDLILSSSPPQTGHMVARQLKKKFGTPWVADLRDLWTQNHYYLYGELRKKLERRLELRTLRTADALVTVSPYLGEQLCQLHGRDSVAVIPNGFNSEEINPEPQRTAPIFTLTFTGTMYEGIRGPDILFEALEEIQREGRITENDIRIRMIGPICENVLRKAQKLGLMGMVQFKGVMSRADAIEAQRTSHVLLLFSNDPTDRHVCSAKFYEYLAALRPVIALGKYRGDRANILEKNGVSVQATDKEGAKAAIMKYYHERTGSRSIVDTLPVIRHFDQIVMTKSFVQVMDGVSSSSMERCI